MTTRATHSQSYVMVVEFGRSIDEPSREKDGIYLVMNALSFKKNS